jgi:hypothetical protein
MSTTPTPSPELLAVDLLRVQMESMTIEELQDHIEALRQAIVSLVESKMMRPHISPQSVANIERLRHKLQARLSYALDLLESLRVAAAWLQAAQHADGDEKAGSASRPQRLPM